MGLKNLIKTMWMERMVIEDNSSLAIRCIAPNICEYRHTTICAMCNNNIHAKFKEKNYFNEMRNRNIQNREDC